MLEDDQLLQAASWRRSSWCAVSSCVEVAVLPGKVLVRDSRDASAVLVYPSDRWGRFVEWVRGSQGVPGEAGLVVEYEDRVRLFESAEVKSLIFARSEWEVFLRGVRAGEFDA
ncbi:hypothetical protein Kisp01_62860 [Kineosporia sp. NBRC 101677]|uniref:DUF397 domain-containing protein n=1 Tax=Kineosporia TaxID=49184 RepID=UPI000AD0049A|nr:hypothetical protein Kisp01_62860 [Kineosporia sp. NBRC 101677]